MQSLLAAGDSNQEARYQTKLFLALGQLSATGPISKYVFVREGLEQGLSIKAFVSHTTYAEGGY
ncbi:MAG: hypothetical protein M0R02_14705 [Bacteroidales bacterium]|nr:hypothetical protein [Bacteroidales bacterium]